VLAAVDEALNRAETLTQEFEVVNQHPGKAEETFALTLLTKGTSGCWSSPLRRRWRGRGS